MKLYQNRKPTIPATPRIRGFFMPYKRENTDYSEATIISKNNKNNSLAILKPNVLKSLKFISIFVSHFHLDYKGENYALSIL